MLSATPMAGSRASQRGQRRHGDPAGVAERVAQPRSAVPGQPGIGDGPGGHAPRANRGAAAQTKSTSEDGHGSATRDGRGAPA